MRTFRLLKADEIECRIQQTDKKGQWVQIMLYKTARTDAKLFDETFGVFGWANDYKLIDEKMYCGIGVRAENGEWVWKWNVGTESNTEAAKGEASDALKRAGFVWGCGTELYSCPSIFINDGEACNIKDEGNGRYVCRDRFNVTYIEYDENEHISKLIICNSKSGKVAFTYSEKSKNTKPAPAATQATPAAPVNSDPTFKCADCGSVLKPYTTDEGKNIGVRQHANGSMKKFGRYLCLTCIDKVKANG